MKRLFIVTTLIAFYITISAQSCCCTGAGANYSILPNLNKHVVGFNYTYTNYFSETRSLFAELNKMKTEEQLQSLELFGRFNVQKRLQLSIFLPVLFINEHSKVSDSHNNTLGDMSLLLQYSVLNPLRCNGKKSKHQLRIGIGTKLPSGEFKKDKNNMYSTNVQPGTGSIDFLFNAIYTYRYSNFGMNARTGYKLNTVNTQGFRFGNKVETGFNLFYVFRIKQISLMPSAGLSYAHLFDNHNKGLDIYLSNSDLITTPFTFDVYYKHLAFSTGVTPVIYNRVPVRAFKQTFSATAGIYYNF